jgi:predicted type IV restriction endonuclease
MPPFNTLDECQSAFRLLRTDLGPDPVEWNEADTRFHIIDRILVEALGWPIDPSTFRLEAHDDGEYRDYLLGNPAGVIWEAKRTGIHFEFPADISDRTVQSIRSLMAVSPSVEQAIRQVQG